MQNGTSVSRGKTALQSPETEQHLGVERQGSTGVQRQAAVSRGREQHLNIQRQNNTSISRGGAAPQYPEAEQHLSIQRQRAAPQYPEAEQHLSIQRQNNTSISRGG